MGDCDIVQSQANFKDFYYCRTHKEESTAVGCGGKSQDLGPITVAKAWNTTKYLANWPLRQGLVYFVDSQGSLVESLVVPPMPTKDWFIATKNGTFSGYLNDPSSWVVDYT
jgi:hypothetical protein